MLSFIKAPEGYQTVLYRNGSPVRLLVARPKPYLVWGTGFTRVCCPLTDPVINASQPTVSPLMDKDWVRGHLDDILVEPGERVLVWLEGRLVRVLTAGRWGIWKTPSPIRLDRLTLDDPQYAPGDAKAVAALRSWPAASNVLEFVNLGVGQQGLVYVGGELLRTLGPGIHAFWRQGIDYDVLIEDLRLKTLTLTGQELMTQDRVTLRMNFDVAYRVTDPQRAVLEAEAPAKLLYTRAQLLLREGVGGRTLDQLLEERDSLAKEVEAGLQPFAEKFGMGVEFAGLRDVILPGDMREILNQVVRARKEAEANVIRRREETASTRSLLNTAKVIDENPTMLRLKELEALQEIVGKIETLNVYDGLQGLLGGVRLRDLPPGEKAKSGE
ncbi:MAG: slipin family protein [Sumerlaeia bacterium]